MSIGITGLEENQQRINPEHLTTALRAATFAVATEVSGRIRAYPPQRMLLRPYRRTGQLGQGWRVEHVGATGARVTNRVAYAVYVQGDDQVEFHKDAGWKNADGVSEQVQVDGTVTRIAGQALAHIYGG
jgi:hypothetical protein